MELKKNFINFLCLKRVCVMICADKVFFGEGRDRKKEALGLCRLCTHNAPKAFGYLVEVKLPKSFEKNGGDVRIRSTVRPPLTLMIPIP